jgi:hypothetical protein
MANVRDAEGDRESLVLTLGRSAVVIIDTFPR